MGSARVVDCVFCPPNWGNLDVKADFVNIEGHRVLVITPIRPVVEGHVLVISNIHTEDAAEDPRIAAELMRTAANWVKAHQIDANIITNVGAAAAQTVFHTHLHVVPRSPGDGLQLPWTNR